MNVSFAWASLRECHLKDQVSRASAHVLPNCFVKRLPVSSKPIRL